MCSFFAIHRQKYARNSGAKVDDPLKFKLLPPPKPYIYDELCETPQDDSIGISAEKIKDVRALLKYLSPDRKKYYEDIFPKVPVKKSK